MQWNVRRSASYGFLSMHRGDVEQCMGLPRNLDSGAGLLSEHDAWTRGRIGRCLEFRRQFVLRILLRGDRLNATCKPDRTYRNGEMMTVLTLIA